MYLGSTNITGGRWSQTKDTTYQQYIRDWTAAKDFIEATIIALKKKSEAKNSATVAHTQQR
jgi:hypothetical protein